MKLKIFQLYRYFIYLPLVGSNIIFNLGTMILSFTIFGCWGIVYIFLLIALTFILCQSAPLTTVKNIYSRISCISRNATLSISDNDTQNRNWESELKYITDKNGKIRTFLTSFIAPIFLFRPLEKPTYANMLYMIMTQIVPLVVNFSSLLMICLMTSFHNKYIHYPEHVLWIGTSLYFFGICYMISLIMYTREKMQIK